MSDSLYQLVEKWGFPFSLHTFFSHMPIGLVFGAFGFALLSWFIDSEALHRTAGRCLLMGLVTLIPSVLLGYLDWQRFLGGASLDAIRIKSILTAVLLILMVITLMTVSKKQAARFKQVALYFTCSVCMLVIVYYGNVLSHMNKTTSPSPANVIEQETLP